MTDQDLLQAQSAVSEILTALKVDRVIYVDDANNGTLSIEDVIASSISLDSKMLTGVFSELGEHIPDDPDVLSRKIRDIWGELDSQEREKRAQDVLILARRSSGDETDDIADASILSGLIPKTKLISLSPSEWEQRKAQILNDSRDLRTLFLFDRDFTEAGGDSEGIKIIASLLSNNETGHLICGLLTHTVTPETQSQQWAELSREHQIPRDRFVVIPKLHLSKAPIIFAQTLKYVALSPDFTELKSKTKEIIAAAADVAAKRVEEVSIYDLDHIVFQVSADEGLWEPDMLFRLHALFHRLESRRLAHEGGVLEEIASKLRAVSGIPTNCDLFTPTSNAWKLQREELYEFNDHINKNHFPIETGDIFERVGANSSKRYILLAQPCDLMVRNDGKRHPEIQRIPLLEVVCTKDMPKHSEELLYFGDSSAEKWYVRFRLVHFVCPHILDLCVFNSEGLSKFVQGNNAPSNLRPAWKKRYNHVSRIIGKSVTKAGQFALTPSDPPAVKQAKQKLAQNLEDIIFKDDLFNGSISESGGAKTITYDCKRIARISRARAIGLLMSYTASLNRPAYDRDFGLIEDCCE